LNSLIGKKEPKTWKPNKFSAEYFFVGVDPGDTNHA
jgi:hypothetical protein